MRIFVIFQLPVITIIWGSLAGFTNGKNTGSKITNIKISVLQNHENKQYSF